MNGFLDTGGKLHECESFEHLDCANKIVQNMGVSVSNGVEAEEYLQKMGWIVVRTRDVYGLIGYHKENSNEICYHLTDKQKDWFNKHYENMTKSCREAVDKLFDYDK